MTYAALNRPLDYGAMRLTNVSQMQVQPGVLFSCLVLAEPDGGEPPLPISFDQRRHVGFGSRPGSWMAASLQLPGPATLEEIGSAWQGVLARHGSLRSLFVRGSDPSRPSRISGVEGDAGALSLLRAQITVRGWERLGSGSSPGVLPGSTVRVQGKPPVTREGVLSADEVRDTLRAHFDSVCDPFGRPSHRICVIEPAEDAPASHGVRTPQVVIGCDHSHVDAWSLLVLIRDLSVCLEDVQAGRAPGAELPAAEPFAAHTELLASRGRPPQDVVSGWREILDAGEGAMPGFPLALGDLVVPQEEVVEVRDVFDAEELARVEAYAERQGARLIAVAVSVMTRLARELADQPLRTVFPVHSREDPRWYGSVGWFITNSVLENDDDALQASYAAVKEAIRLGAHPLQPIMRRYGGMPQHPGMFAMSWLDHRKLPVHVAEELNPQHVSAVIRTDGVMVWFVINDSGMHLRCRYPGTRQARRAMRTWMAGLVFGLRAPLEATE